MTTRRFVLIVILALLGCLVALSQAANVPKGIYYTINDGSSFYRCSNPFKDGYIATQSQNPRHVTVSISNEQGYADSGFVLYIGKLSDIDTITITGRGDQFGLNFWFDRDNDGKFFSWETENYLTGAIDRYLGVGNDNYALGPGSTNGALSVDADTPFYSMTSPYGTYTLTQLKNGAMPGVNGDTVIAIWVGVSVSNKVARIDSVSINGQ